MATSTQSPLERYISAVEEIAAAQDVGLTLIELARLCSLPAATSYRVVQALLKSGLIVPRPGGGKAYVLGPRLFRLLHTGTDADRIKLSVQPILDKLAEDLGETCFIARLSGRTVKSIAWAVPESGLRSKVYPGDVMPPNAAASAKAILAFQSAAVVSRALGDHIARFTSRTVTDHAKIAREHAGIRQKGYATCWDEMEDGLCAIACPIQVEGADVQYSVAITGLTQRLKKQALPQVVGRLKKSSQGLSLALRDAVTAKGHAFDT